MRAIAKREAIRFNNVSSRRSAMETSLEALDETVSAELRPLQPEAGAQAWLDSIEKASVCDALSRMEADILTRHLSEPDATWKEIGAAVGAAPHACEVAYLRALKKYRAFLFLHCPDLLGGADAIHAAFVATVASSEDPLTASEAEAFTHIILDGKTDYHRSGWRSDLRRACGKVIRHLSIR